jgi:hypothetical protein
MTLLTIKQIADQQGITMQAVTNRLARADCTLKPCQIYGKTKLFSSEDVQKYFSERPARPVVKCTE